MVTEIQQRPTVEEDRLGQGNETSDALRPGLDDYEDFQGADTGTRNGNFGQEEPFLEEGCLVFTPLPAFEKASQKSAMQNDEYGDEYGEEMDDETEEDPAKDSSEKKKGEKVETKKTEASPQEPVGTDNKNAPTAPTEAGRPEEIRLNSQPADEARTGWTGERVDGQVVEPSQAGTDSTANDSTKPLEGPTPQDSDKIKLNPETQKAKDEFVKVLGDRLRNDPRFRDNPELLKAVTERMAQMDQRVLHEQVKRADGTFVDQQEQLAEKYRDLTRIATDAEKLTYEKDGQEHKVFSEPWMVNNILASAVIRGADPEHFYMQGSNLTCAAESVNRGGDEVLSGVDTKTIADMVTKGEFASVDNRGLPFMCKVDRESLIPDRQAQGIYLEPNNNRDFYGQLGDIRTAQLNLDLMSRENTANRGESGGEGRYMYTLVPPTSQRDSGARVFAAGDRNTESVVDRETGKVIAHSACFDGKGISNTKQALYGRYISPDYGKETTLVSGNMFNIPNATLITSGQQMLSHMRGLEEKGWKLPTIGTNGLNYISNISGPLVWHATSAKLNERGDGIRFVDNRLGEANQRDLSADTLFSWMNAPASAPLADRQRGDHVFSPDGVYTTGGTNPLRETATKPSSDLAMDRDKSQTKKEDDDYLAQLRRSQQKEEENSLKQAAYARVQLAELESRLASLPSNSPERLLLMRQQQMYQNAFHLV